MRVMLLAVFSAGVVAMAGCSKEELKTLSSAEIDALLKGNTVTIESAYVSQSRPFRQYFGENGITVQMAEDKRTGKWRLNENNKFCVLWDTSQQPEKSKSVKNSSAQKADNAQSKQCFQVKQDSQGKYKVYSEVLGLVGTVAQITSGYPAKHK